MSKNATRLYRNQAKPFNPLLVDPRFMYPDYEGDAELRKEAAMQAMLDAYRAEVEQQKADALQTKRANKGVAWVAHLKYEVDLPIPEVTIKPRRRGVVILQGHKYCWLPLAN